MYASVRKYSVDPERVDELMHRVDERLAPGLVEMPGFVAYQAIDAGVDRAGEGTVFAVTICSDREAADRSAEIAAEFVRDELGEMEVDRLEAATGAVCVNRAVSEVLETAHA
jgi:Antibiotic biosynthesis monooxygenase